MHSHIRTCHGECLTATMRCVEQRACSCLQPTSLTGSERALSNRSCEVSVVKASRLAKCAGNARVAAYCCAKDQSSSDSSHGKGDAVPSCTINAISLGMLIISPPFLIVFVAIMPLMPLMCPACSLGAYMPPLEDHFNKPSMRSSATCNILLSAYWFCLV